MKSLYLTTSVRASNLVDSCKISSYSRALPIVDSRAKTTHGINIRYKSGRCIEVVKICIFHKLLQLTLVIKILINLGYGHIEVTLSTKSWCNADKVISKFDPRTQPVNVDSEKIVLSVPHTETLPQSLDNVENEKKNLGVTGISVSLITLEEVFLKYVIVKCI